MNEEKYNQNLGLQNSLGYGWAICGLKMTQYVTPMTAKKSEEDISFKKQDKKKRTFHDYNN